MNKVDFPTIKRNREKDRANQSGKRDRSIHFQINLHGPDQSLDEQLKPRQMKASTNSREFLSVILMMTHSGPDTLASIH